jgi:hypothetical protein
MSARDDTRLDVIRRKLRAVTAMLQDRAPTEHEKANAEAVKARLEKQLRDRGAPQGDWTDVVFRLGRAVRKMGQPASPPSPKGDWTDHAFRLGKTLRRGIKEWRPK